MSWTTVALVAIAAVLVIWLGVAALALLFGRRMFGEMRRMDGSDGRDLPHRDDPNRDRPRR